MKNFYFPIVKCENDTVTVKNLCFIFHSDKIYAKFLKKNVWICCSLQNNGNTYDQDT